MAGSRRCMSCHEKTEQEDTWLFSLPNSFYVRIDRPERNAFLTAPLAKVAGGTGACGDAVFETTDDPDYRRLMESFAALHAQLEIRPSGTT